MVELAFIADISRALLAPFFIFALLALALNLQWGHTGLLNAGVAGFFAIGAYMGAMFTTPTVPPSLGVPGHIGFADYFPNTIPVVVLVALWAGAGVALLVGYTVARRSRPALGRRLAVLGVLVAVVAGALSICNLVGLSTQMVVGSIVAMALTGFIGLLIAIPTLRLRADYLAIATLALSAIVVEVIRNAEAITGGVYGITSVPRPWEYGAETWKTELTYAIFLGIILLIVFVAINRATRAPWGRVLRAVREDEDAALTMGKNTYYVKLQVFVFACALMGLAGVLFTVLIRAVFPDPFTAALTFSILVMVIIGGRGSNIGVVIGAFLLAFLEYFTVRAKSWFDLPPLVDERIFYVRLIVLGVVLIALVLFRPRGIIPEPRRVAKKPRFVFGRTSVAPPPADPARREASP